MMGDRNICLLYGFIRVNTPHCIIVLDVQMGRYDVVDIRPRAGHAIERRVDAADRLIARVDFKESE